jgi:phosphoglycerate dehydrogenase-like enzyme
LLSEEVLGGAKDGLILVNVAGNSILDEPALLRALDEGRIKSAALDAPPQSDELRIRENVFVTPGIAWYTAQALDRNAQMVVESVKAIAGGSPRFVVNP